MFTFRVGLDCRNENINLLKYTARETSKSCLINLKSLFECAEESL